MKREHIYREAARLLADGDNKFVNGFACCALNHVTKRNPRRQREFAYWFKPTNKHKSANWWPWPDNNVRVLALLFMVELAKRGES